MTDTRDYTKSYNGENQAVKAYNLNYTNELQVNGTTVLDSSGKLSTTGGVVSSAIDSSVIQNDVVSITSAEILALNTTPKQLIAAPGTGKAIVPIEFCITLDYGSAAYATNTDMEIHWDDSAAGDAAGAEVTAASFDAILLKTADDVERQTVTTSDETNIPLNKGISITVATGDPVTGDSPIKVYCTYRIIDL